MNKSRKAQIEYFSLAIISLMTFTSGLIFVANSTNISTDLSNTINKIGIVEFWADTLTSITIEQNIIRSRLILDNGTTLSGQEIELP